MGTTHVAPPPILTLMNTDTAVTSNPVSLNYEVKRLETFNSWLTSAPIEAARLAKAGFYYTGTELEVECFACHVKISDWKYGDNVNTALQEI